VVHVGSLVVAVVAVVTDLHTGWVALVVAVLAEILVLLGQQTLAEAVAVASHMLVVLAAPEVQELLLFDISISKV
jgi:hypothetical protein